MAATQPTFPTSELELTILMPCLNESETIATCIDKARGYLGKSGIAGEVLVADNGSTDGSREIAAAHGARVVHVAARGYGAALKAGIEAANGRYVIMGDADDSYDFSDLSAFVSKLRGGADLVMGNRFQGGIAPGAMPRLHRYLGNPVLSGIGRLFFKSPIGDFHCGLRGFRRSAIAALGLDSPGMEFASEMVVKATLRDQVIVEVPTTLKPDGRSRPPHLRSWRDGWRHLRFLLLFCPRWLFFYPGVFLFAAGLASLVWLEPRARQVFGVELDVNTLAFSVVAIVCGFEAIFFSVFAGAVAADMRVLPRDPVVERVRRFWTLERGLLGGVAVFTVGLLAALAAVGDWGRQSFGPLDPAMTLRIVLPAAAALIIGLQLVFATCLLSVLNLRAREKHSEGNDDELTHSART
jgi:glycosyltransferase involved in cell wall biosynthesis